MSLRTSDRRHWCGSPPVEWKQLGFTTKMFENPGDCARRKYPWGTTPACALVRNDRAFSNSPQIFSCVSGFPGDRSGSPGAWGLRPPRCLAWVLPFSLPSRHFSPSGVSPVRICRTGGLYSAASSKRGFTFWRYSLAKSRPVTRADMTSAMGKDHQTLSTLPVRLSR